MKHGVWSLMFSAVLVAATYATAGEALDKAKLDKLRAGIEAPGVGLKVGSARTTDIPGLYEVQLADGPIVYANAEGSFFIVGDLYSVTPDGYVNLGEQRRDGERAETLAAVKREDMIIYSPKGETRTHISVFFDDTCYYCQKLHEEVPQLNKNGVEVRYLAYPRAGVNSDAYRNLASAWCAEDRHAAFDRLSSRQSVPENVCDGNPVAAQFQLGQTLGVRGTPAIITESGQMIPGYQSAKDLMVSIGLN